MGIQISPLLKAVEWFEKNHEQVFDWLEIPNDSQLMTLFRKEAKARILCGLRQDRWQEVRYMYDGLFIEEMRDLLRANGYTRPAGEDRFSIKSLKSSDCLRRIWNGSKGLSIGYARWAADMTPEGLENEPCYELIRVRNRMEIRNWPLIWEAAGGKFYGGAGSNEDFPMAAGRMIAKKTDRIWNDISGFGSPWPPFDLSREMGLRGIFHMEAEELGVTQEDESFELLERPFNEGVRLRGWSFFLRWLGL